MQSKHFEFWKQPSFVVIGNSARMKFPFLTYQGLKNNGKRVFAVDTVLKAIESDQVFVSVGELPMRPSAAVIEVPSDESASVVAKVAEAGIGSIWIHDGCESQEALSIAKNKGLNVLHGTCAVMYLMPNAFPHCIHKWIMKLAGKY